MNESKKQANNNGFANRKFSKEELESNILNIQRVLCLSRYKFLDLGDYSIQFRVVEEDTIEVEFPDHEVFYIQNTTVLIGFALYLGQEKARKLLNEYYNGFKSKDEYNFVLSIVRDALPIHSFNAYGFYLRDGVLYVHYREDEEMKCLKIEMVSRVNEAISLTEDITTGYEDHYQNEGRPHYEEWSIYADENGVVYVDDEGIQTPIALIESGDGAIYTAVIQCIHSYRLQEAYQKEQVLS